MNWNTQNTRFSIEYSEYIRNFFASFNGLGKGRHISLSVGRFGGYIAFLSFSAQKVIVRDIKFSNVCSVANRTPSRVRKRLEESFEESKFSFQDRPKGEAESIAIFRLLTNAKFANHVLNAEIR